MSKEFYLKPHNKEASAQVEKAYSSGKQIASIVEVTGGGKTFVALDHAQKIYPKKMLFISPSVAIIEQVIHTIDEYNLNEKVNIEFKTYQALVDVTRNQIKQAKFDMLVVDEFHHMGAPIWGQRIEDLISTHPQAKVLGMSAYHVRNRGKYNALDVAPTLAELELSKDDFDEEKQEDLPIFTDSIVFEYDLAQALVDGVLPKPKYVTCSVKLLEYASILEERVKNSSATSEEKQKYLEELRHIASKLDEAKNFDDIMRNHMREGDKCIYFAPVGVNADTGRPIIDEVVDSLKKTFPDAEIYTTTSKQVDGKQNRDAFYSNVDLNGKDVSSKLRIMVAIQQYDQGVHVPGVNRIVLGTTTQSDIAFGERIGRGLSATGTQDVTILDLGGNLDLMLQIQQECYDIFDNFKQNIDAGNDSVINMRLKLTPQFPFMLDEELVNLLNKLEDIDSHFDKWQEKCNAYYSFITQNEREPVYTTENKVEKLLYNWADRQRTLNKRGLLSERRFRILEQRGFVFDVIEAQWQKRYEEYKQFVERNGRQPKQIVKEKKGNDEDKVKEASLATWGMKQRQVYQAGRLSDERIILLQECGWDCEGYNKSWQQSYEEYKQFVERNGRQPKKIEKEKKGGDEDKAKEARLAMWVAAQRRAYQAGRLSDEKIILLQECGWDCKMKRHIKSWQQSYEEYKQFVERNGRKPKQIKNEKIGDDVYKAEEDRLAIWGLTQRRAYQAGRLSDEKIILLQECGWDCEGDNKSWQQRYEKYKQFVERNGRQPKYIEKEKVGDDEEKAKENRLAQWGTTQRRAYQAGRLSDEKIILLQECGWDCEGYNKSWQQSYEEYKQFVERNGRQPRKIEKEKIGDDEDKAKEDRLATWGKTQKRAYQVGSLSDEKIILLQKCGWDCKMKRHIKSWQKSYEEYKQFVERNGRQPKKIEKEKIGDDEDKAKEARLANWGIQQRQKLDNGTMSKDRYIKLRRIGIFDTKEQKAEEEKQIAEFFEGKGLE